MLILKGYKLLFRKVVLFDHLCNFLSILSRCEMVGLERPHFGELGIIAPPWNANSDSLRKFIQ
jgi:hypothetical protein